LLEEPSALAKKELPAPPYAGLLPVEGGGYRKLSKPTQAKQSWLSKLLGFSAKPGSAAKPALQLSVVARSYAATESTGPPAECRKTAKENVALLKNSVGTTLTLKAIQEVKHASPIAVWENQTESKKVRRRRQDLSPSPVEKFSDDVAGSRKATKSGLATATTTLQTSEKIKGGKSKRRRSFPPE
jgi:hypothetical protein